MNAAVCPFISMCYLLKQAFSEDWRVATASKCSCDLANAKGFELKHSAAAGLSGGRLLRMHTDPSFHTFSRDFVGCILYIH